MTSETKYRIRNWKDYNRSLVKRGGITGGLSCLISICDELEPLHAKLYSDLPTSLCAWQRPEAIDNAKHYRPGHRFDRA